MDLMTRRILTHIARDAGCDVPAIAAAVGCSQEVAADRIRRLQEDGIVRGFRADVDRARVGAHHEALVVGVPSHETDPARLRRLAGEPDVQRVYTLATNASIAFHLHGSDPDELERRAEELAQDAGLRSHRCTLVVASIDAAAASPIPIVA